ncbi:hypothetical protein G7Z17_g5753 [Cylindrodendrum hubeiense]|uniref:Uncharacterized protein n=1 Tax=Cylindrodendrum hubeiense TaxID=595255 RepID=A0A9P5HBH7_9HYPO|nr:hypothetical protein G7Z17_g5753 [Cylindrodendrum hubeiense]
MANRAPNRRVTMTAANRHHYFPGTELSILDQASSRHFNRLLYCFPLPSNLGNNATEVLVNDFRVATDQIIDKWPFLASRIRLSQPEEPAGEVELFWDMDQMPLDCDRHRWFSTKDVLLFKRVNQWGERRAPKYQDLVVRGVPPSMLREYGSWHVPHATGLQDHQGQPVYQITVTFVRGGLMLGVCYANSVLDSYAHAIVFEELARQVRDPKERVQTKHPSVEALYERHRVIQGTWRPGVTIELGHTLAAWIWVSIVRARGRRDTWRTHLAYSVDVRNQLWIPDDEMYLRNTTLYNRVPMASSTVFQGGNSLAPDKVVEHAARAIHLEAQKFNPDAVHRRLGYMATICQDPGSLKYDVNTVEKNDVIIDSLIAAGGEADFGSVPVGRSMIELGQPRFLEEDAMARLTTGLRAVGVHCAM